MVTPCEDGLSDRRCLIVDDEPALRRVLRRLMQAEGYAVLEAESAEEALVLQEQAPVPLILSDYHMPGLGGAALLATVRERWPLTAVVMVTAVSDVHVAVRCLEAGALDYVTKPFTTDEVRTRVQQALEKRRLLCENKAYREHLEERVAEQARRYEQLFLASLRSLAEALEVKDAYTWGHSTRVSMYAMAIARELATVQPLSPDLLEQLELGSRLHDIGKIGVREEVLNKAGPLTDAEYAHIMEHPVIGWRLLSPLLNEMPHALAVVRSHHERIDGEGIPDRLRGDDIPLVARITAVADSFDAMTSGRPYRDGMSVADALAELERCAGTQFDEACVAAFRNALQHRRILWPDRHVQRATRLAVA